jgi:hypothetical protein
MRRRRDARASAEPAKNKSMGIFCKASCVTANLTSNGNIVDNNHFGRLDIVDCPVYKLHTNDYC